MRILLIDDERLARNELKKLIMDNFTAPEIQEAPNANLALSLYADFQPQAMFVDIKMPGMSGFEMLEKMHPPMPQIVFTTAYSEYAIRAFEYNALDYLVKPIDPARFKDTADRIQSRIKDTEQKEPTPASLSLMSEDDKVFVRDGDKCWFIATKDMRLLESEGNYTRIYFHDEKPLLLRSLNSLEERLNPRTFFRANRSQILNINHITSIEPWFSGGLKVIVAGELNVEFSRRQARLFREKMSL